MQAYHALTPPRQQDQQSSPHVPLWQQTRNRLMTKTIILFKNGDSLFGGKKCSVPPHLRTLKALMKLITLVLRPTFGPVKKLFSARNGKLVTTLSQVINGEKYVAAPNEKYKPLPDGYHTTEERASAMERKRIMVSGSCKSATGYTSRQLTIHVFKNAVRAPAKRFALTKRQLDEWDSTMNNIANALDTYGGQLRGLYTLEGKMLQGPWEARNNAFYVAVEHNRPFRRMDYMKIHVHFSRENTLKRAAMMRNKTVERTILAGTRCCALQQRATSASLRPSSGRTLSANKKRRLANPMADAYSMAFPDKRRRCIILRLLRNGSAGMTKPAKKFVLLPRDLDNWSRTCQIIGKAMSYASGSISGLYSLDGDPVPPYSLNTGECYVAVGHGEQFLRRDYYAACDLQRTSQQMITHSHHSPRVKPRRRKTKSKIVAELLKMPVMIQPYGAPYQYDIRKKSGIGFRGNNGDNATAGCSSWSRRMQYNTERTHNFMQRMGQIPPRYAGDGEDMVSISRVTSAPVTSVRLRRRKLTANTTELWSSPECTADLRKSPSQAIQLEAAIQRIDIACSTQDDQDFVARQNEYVTKLDRGAFIDENTPSDDLCRKAIVNADDVFACKKFREVITTRPRNPWDTPPYFNNSTTVTNTCSSATTFTDFDGKSLSPVKKCLLYNQLSYASEMTCDDFEYTECLVTPIMPKQLATEANGDDSSRCSRDTVATSRQGSNYFEALENHHEYEKKVEVVDQETMTDQSFKRDQYNARVARALAVIMPTLSLTCNRCSEPSDSLDLRRLASATTGSEKSSQASKTYTDKPVATDLRRMTQTARGTKRYLGNDSSSISVRVKRSENGKRDQKRRILESSAPPLSDQLELHNPVDIRTLPSRFTTTKSETNSTDQVPEQRNEHEGRNLKKHGNIRSEYKVSKNEENSIKLRKIKKKFSAKSADT